MLRTGGTARTARRSTSQKRAIFSRVSRLPAGAGRPALDGAAEEVAAALLLDDGVVDLAHGEGGGLGQVFVDEALVMAEVEVGLGAVGGDEDLAVLVGGHRAGVDVAVGGGRLAGEGAGVAAVEW